MRSKFLSVICVASFALTPFAQAQDSGLEALKASLNSKPYETKPANNDEVFAKYCTGNADSTDISQPQYSNPLVKSAAVILTSTKVQADERLKVRAEQTFIESLQYLTEELNTIISTSKNAELVKVAKVILSEVSAPGVTGISTNAKAAYQTLGKSVASQFTDLAPKLAAGLTADLEGINPEKLKAAGKELEKVFKSEFTTVDYNVLQTGIIALQMQIGPKIEQFDLKAILKAAKQVVEYTTNAENSEELSYITEQAQDVVNTIESADPALLAQLNYKVSNLSYYTNDDETFLKGKAEIASAAAVFLAESAKSDAMTVVTEMSTTLQAVIAKDVGTLNYSVESMLSYIEAAAQKDGTLLGDNSTEQTKYLKIMSSIRAEGAKFAQEYIMESVVKMNQAFADGRNDDAVSIATNDLSYSLSNLKTTLTDKGQQVVNTFRAEVSKSASDEIKTNANTLVTELEKAKGNMTEELGYAIQNLGYSLENPVAVSAATQKLVAAYKAAFVDSNALTSIASYIDPVLQMSESGHFYFYAGVRKLYGLDFKVKLPEAAVKAGANREAHWFLTQLCGEFRDRATMIESKLNWIQNINILKKDEAAVKDPATLAQAKNVWMRITAAAYYPYINFTSVLWEAKREAQERYITVGNRTDVDNPVKGCTVCETKYIFAKYIAEERGFDNIEEYNAGYEEFKADCPKADLTDYYDFRGDSNFKHYSPESNGMIWYATTIGAACKSRLEAGNNKFYQNIDCENYFKRPYFYRYNAARAGLSAWLFHSADYNDTFGASGAMVAIYPHTQPQLAPFSFGFDQNTTEGATFGYEQSWLDIEGAWNSNDIGYNTYTGLGTDNVNYDLAFELIRAAVDRHTDWYNSGYNDSVGRPKDQAYSPFVASSYEMSASNGFTSCGTTVQCPPDGLKRWMFIFRIKAQNWYTPDRVAAGEPINFDTMWFDETSFGDSGLANSEKAWDRLGTAQEEELDSILYLINVDDDGGGEHEEMEEGFEEGAAG